MTGTDFNRLIVGDGEVMGTRGDQNWNAEGQMVVDWA